MSSKRVASRPPRTRASKRGRPNPSIEDDEELSFGDSDLEPPEGRRSQDDASEGPPDGTDLDSAGDGDYEEEDEDEDEEEDEDEDLRRQSQHRRPRVTESPGSSDDDEVGAASDSDSDEEEEDEEEDLHRQSQHRRRRVIGSRPGSDDSDVVVAASNSDSDSVSDGPITRNTPVRSEDEKGLPLQKHGQEIDDALEAELANFRSIAKQNGAKKDVIRFLRRMRRNNEEHHEWVANHGRFSKERVLKALEPVFYDFWTEDDEAELVREVQQDHYYQWLPAQLRLPGSTSNNHYQPMWTRMLGLRKCRPTDIIGPGQFLEYGATPDKTLGGQAYPEPIWTGNFCAQLLRLVTCCCPDGDVQLVCVFLRYAVACRINDRRRMPLLHTFVTDDEFLDDLQSELDDTDGSRSLVKIHQDVRNDWRQRMAADPTRSVKLPWYSDMLRNIEKELYRQDTAKFRGPVGLEFVDFEPYKVLTKDLFAVVRAFDSVRQNGIALFANSADTAKSVGETRKFDGVPYPKTLPDFKELLAKVYLSERRLLAQRRQSAQRCQAQADRAEEDSEGDVRMGDGDEEE